MTGQTLILRGNAQRQLAKSLIDKAPRTKECGYCGKTFAKDPRNTWKYWERAKYCGQKCAAEAWSLRAKKKRKPLHEDFGRWFIRGDKDACWEWSGSRDRDGYGAYFYEGKGYRAHRLALELANGPIPNGMLCCHTCNNPPCVNPRHLYAGTVQDNVDDTRRSGNIPNGERCHSAKLTKSDIRAIRASNETNVVLGARFGVAPSNISHIQRRKTWRHVK